MRLASHHLVLVPVVSSLLACAVRSPPDERGQKVGVSRQALTPTCGDGCPTCVRDGVFDAVVRASKKFGLPRWFYLAIINRESTFCKDTVNVQRDMGNIVTCGSNAQCEAYGANACTVPGDCYSYAHPCQNGTCTTGWTCNASHQCTDCGKGLTQLTPARCDFNGATLGVPYPFDLDPWNNGYQPWEWDTGLNLGGDYTTPSPWIRMRDVNRFNSIDDAFNPDRNLERFTTSYAAPAYYLMMRRAPTETPEQLLRRVAYGWNHSVFDMGYPQPPAADTSLQLYDQYVTDFRQDVEDADYGQGQHWPGSTPSNMTGFPSQPPYVNEPNDVNAPAEPNLPSITSATASASPLQIAANETTTITATITVSSLTRDIFDAVVEIRVFDKDHNVQPPIADVPLTLSPGQTSSDATLDWKAPVQLSGPYHVEVGVRPASGPSGLYYYWNTEAETGLCVSTGLTSEIIRDSSGFSGIVASGCFDTSAQAHFLGSRGAFHTALTFNNPSLPLATSCQFGDSCLKFTPDCRTQAFVRGSPVAACGADGLSDPNEITCHCQAPDLRPFTSLIPAGGQQNLSPFFLVDVDADNVVDSEYRDKFGAGGDRFRMYPLFPTFWRWDLEDMNTPPAGDFNDFLAAIEIKDCRPNEIFPPYTMNFGTGDTHIDCSDTCNNNACEVEQTAPGGPLRFTVALGIDETQSEADRESRGRKLHLTVATHSDRVGEELAVCPVLVLDWQEARDPGDTKDLTQLINYGSDSDCGPTPHGNRATGEHICLGTDDQSLVMDGLPISMSVADSATPCHRNRSIDEATKLLPENAQCGASTLVRDFELPIADIDAALVNSALHYGNLSRAALEAAVQRVDLYIFRDLERRLRRLPSPEGDVFLCPSGVNALLRAAPSSVAQVTKYRFNAPSRPNRTPGFTIYTRQ